MALPTAGKLVRDRIPDQIRASGKHPQVTTIADSDVLDALRGKLLEEARELVVADTSSVLEEAADVAEVIIAIANHLGYDWADVENLRSAKRFDRGGFEAGVWLLAVDE